VPQPGSAQQQEEEAPALEGQPEQLAGPDFTVFQAPESVAPTPAGTQIQAASCYATTELTAEFRQGEIITGLEQVVRILPDGTAEVKQHPFAVVFSQDCDLAADHRARQKADPKAVMNGILLFEAFPFDGFISTLGLDKSERKQVRQNNNVRYHILEPAAAAEDLQGQGFTALTIDFRRYFTLTADDMSGQLALVARRRARLVSPYVEHLQCRALHYLGRVALPDSH
jgi:hypothetical protein